MGVLLMQSSSVPLILRVFWSQPFFGTGQDLGRFMLFCMACDAEDAKATTLCKSPVAYWVAH